MRTAGALLLVASLLPALPAEELHVNPVVGSDLAGTGAPAAPFRSLAHALGLARAGDTVVASIGTFDSRSGERFPLVLGPGVSLKGQGTRDTLILAGSPWVPALRATVPGGGSHPIRLAGFTVLGGSACLEVLLEGEGALPALELSALALEDGGQGLLIRDRPGPAGLSGALTLERSLIQGNWGPGLSLVATSAAIALRAVNCAVLDNGQDGLLAWQAGALAALDLGLVHCTIARNGGAGLRLQGAGAVGPAWVAGSILWGNRGGDLAGVDPGGVEHSLLGGGPAVGLRGNRAGEPCFLSARDWHIGHGSAALGMGRRDLPGLPALDLDGQERAPGAAPDAGADQQVLHTLIADPRGARIFRPLCLKVFTLPGAWVTWLVSVDTFFPGFAFPGLTGSIQLNFILALEQLGSAAAGADGVAEIAPNVFNTTAVLGMRVPLQALGVRILSSTSFEGGWSNVVVPGLVLP